MKLHKFVLFAVLSLSLLFTNSNITFAETVDDYSILPPFVSSGVPPLVMLNMARNHKLYYEAYNDITDLDGDAVIDIGYKGYHTALDGSDHSADAIDYYGYFDSFKCYEYDSANNRFNPSSVTTDKTCSGANEWSGDFLNYVSMSRMDTLRKVLYGGYRSTDSTSETVLERVFIPQDAHSWGKEYGSYVDSGGNIVEPEYNIEDFTPLAYPAFGTRHLIANTSLGNSSPPVMRVMPNSTHRIWEWVAKERPVADSSLEDLSGGGVYTGHPADHTDYENLVLEFANASHLQGSQNPSQINGSGNPFGDDDYYLTVFDGEITIASGDDGTYQFAVNGDDAVEVIVDGTVVAGWYGGHGSTSMADAAANHSGSIALTAGTYTIEFRHQEATGGDNYYLYWNGPASGGVWQLVPPSAFSSLTQTVYNVDRGTVAASVITDYEVRVKVCDATYPEANCKQYPNGAYKPTGLLQKHGENNQMYFGLMTGSYAKNTSGGVLRKNVGTITDEIDLNTGQFTATNGIISTINKLKIVGFDYGSHSYNVNCGWIATRPINEGECRMWGNPIGEIMYESLRYFAGKSGPSTTFDYSGTTDDNTLGLPKPAWQNPYDATTGFPDCAQPYLLVLSDTNNNFDSNSLPGSYFNASYVGDLTGLDVESLGDTIWDTEFGSGTTKSVYIGQSGSISDGAPTEKTADSFGNLRGLAPEEPTKQGSFYPASVAYYGHMNDLNAAASNQKVTTFGVALSSPLPRIEIDTDNDGSFDVTLVPFAKSVGGYGISAASTAFQPTNTIVDVFMQEQTPTYGRFRINYEDVEQGADHDMDAIATYEYTVNNDGTLTINVASEYAAGSIIQHMGYVISGTTADGTYLVVRDVDTATYNDPDYFLDTPPGEGPGGTWNDGVALPLSSSRTFTASGNPATILNNPLWYAAKWGGFEDKNGNNVPDATTAALKEWDEGPGSSDGDPDTYFYVTNPLYLEQQLGRSFAEILRRSSSGTAASVISSSRSGEGAIYQSLFFTTQTDQASSANTVLWTGQTHSLFVDSYGNMREDTNGNAVLDMTSDYIIEFVETGTTGNIQTVVNKYTDVNGDGKLTGTETTATDVHASINELAFVWNSGDWLNEISNTNILTNRGTYISSADNRYVLTFIDADGDMVADSGEVKPFLHNEATVVPYVHGLSPFDLTLLPADLDDIRVNHAADYPTALTEYQVAQRQRVIKFIRGQDQGDFSFTTTGGYSLTVPAMRSRAFNDDADSDIETWRLGDIVYSTPTVVATPAEDYDLLYYDRSYSTFYLKYRHRRNVVYVGANDGMLHAFNGGFYNTADKGFYRKYDSTATPNYSNSTTEPVLGTELWAYVPFNLLPHLYWLTEQGYDTEKHVAFVDLKPRVFDAKIFTAEAVCAADPYASGCIHPNGWGTVMVVGMRFGGGALQADTNGDNLRTDSAGNAEPVARSAFVVMDITNPEQPPTVLAELSFNDLGFTTAFPTVAVFRDRGDSATPTGDNDWYLVLGSGPYDSTAGGPGGAALLEATSDQTAKIYMVDLVELVQNGVVEVINSSGAPVSGASIASFASLDSDAFVSDLVTADFDLDYRADAVYFGTVSGDFAAGWGGKLRRLVFADNSTATTWDNDSVLIDLTNVSNDGSGSNGQPIVAAPSIAQSQGWPLAATHEQNDRWVYFGTGRFFNRNDVNNLFTADDDQAYYGIKEPINSSGNFTWGTVNNADLLDTTTAAVYEDGYTVTGLSVDIGGSGTTSDFSFDELVLQMKNRDTGYGDVFAGWRFDLTDVRERNLGQGALLGDILTFSTYMPAVDACEIEGSGNIYAVYFTTGTAYKQSIFGLGTNTVTEDRDGDGTAETTVNDVQRKRYIGRGMTLTPNLHVGRNKGSKAFLQTSTGGILGFEQEAPGATKSGVVSWEVQ